MREAATNLEFEEAARLRDEIKRMKMLDLEFANEALTEVGEQVDAAAPKRWRAEAAAEKAERFRKGRERFAGILPLIESRFNRSQLERAVHENSFRPYSKLSNRQRRNQHRNS